MKLNAAVPSTPIYTHEGGKATKSSTLQELRRTVLTCLLWEDTFYEKGSDIAKRMAELVQKVTPAEAAGVAIEARSKYYLRHVPLFIISELSKVKGAGKHVETALYTVIQRPDELAEFLAIYWKDGKHPIAAAVKRALADAFTKFNAYQLAKYNRDAAIKLRDVMFMVHPKPKTQEQAEVWKKLVDGTLESPDTWEVQLSAGKDKKETFERLLREGKLGGLATLRNLRNMQQSGVNENLIRERLEVGIEKAFPYRFITAAKYAPTLEDALEKAMFKAVEEVEQLPGKTGLLVDISGSMDAKINPKSDSSRIDVACGLAVLLRERAEDVKIATFSDSTVEVAPRRGFALRDAIHNSQHHSATYLAKSLKSLKSKWTDIDRLIVITDEQSSDGSIDAWVDKSYVINVAPYKNGVSYKNGWNHIDGWSERVFDYILEIEKDGE